jgi:hypothetical protein
MDCHEGWIMSNEQSSGIRPAPFNWTAKAEGDDVIRGGEFDLGNVPGLSFAKVESEIPKCHACGKQPPVSSKGPKIVELERTTIFLCETCEMPKTE